MPCVIHGRMQREGLEPGVVSLTFDLDLSGNADLAIWYLQGAVAISYGAVHISHSLETTGNRVDAFLRALRQLRKASPNAAILEDADGREMVRADYRQNHHPCYVVSVGWSDYLSFGAILPEMQHMADVMGCPPRAGFYCAALGFVIEDDQMGGLVEWLDEMLLVTGVSLDLPY